MVRNANPETSREAGASRLQADLAARIMRMLHQQNAGPGCHLVELDLCRTFGVSRTPIRGALKLLSEQGLLEARANRGFVLLKSVTEVPESEPANPQKEQDQNLLVEIARARNNGSLPAECSQQEMLRLFGVNLASLLRVLRQLQDLGLVERKPGNGWSFPGSIDSQRAQRESYAFRRLIEPAGLIEPTFRLDADWLEKSRQAHIAFRKRRWRDTLAVEFYNMNSDFHEQLARCSGNRYLLDAVRRQNQLRSFLNYHWVHGVERAHESITEHLAIMDALAGGENELARNLMFDHLAFASQAHAPVREEEDAPEVAA